jgi:glutamate racemase
MAFVSHAPTILVFDSGLGGLTVFREIVKLRPDARHTYVADDAYFPMASTPRTRSSRWSLIGDLIAEHRPDLVVIACNTASTLVMTHLRETYSVPFVGTVPAIKPACASSKTKRVSVLGTRAR